MARIMDRRTLMRGGLATALLTPALARAAEPALIPIRTDPAQVFRTTVCLRPFRASGPRIEAETVGRKQVIHNYGHGGSGWSLSWGSADVAVGLAMQSSPRKLAVIGAGALGLTAAITAQRAGADVTIYAKDRFPFVRSARATGIWSPDSRVAQTVAMSADFPALWERMARTSAAMHESFVGSAGNPVEWIDNYVLRDPQPEPAAPSEQPAAPEPFDPGFAVLNDRLRGLMPAYGNVAPETTPFAATQVRRGANLSFNIADYGRQLEADFLLAGGRFEHIEFHDPSDLSKLKEKVIINCTGYGARALWRDESVIPIRGQIVWLTPQEGVHYGFYHDGMGVLARRDGIVVQDYGPDEAFGWNDANETADPVAAQATLEKLKAIYRA
jgi:glycine/D-amino acid oxidase-like deaminating enzyme